jgi:hypothetical protein
MKALVLLLPLLAGCVGNPVIPTEVRVPVPVSCVTEQPKKPAMLSDAELRALDDFKLPIALTLDRRVRQAYEAELEAVLAGCLTPKSAALERLRW